MSASPSTGEFRQINPALIAFSKSPAQNERRKHFNKEQLAELIADVKQKGIIQPIVVRPAFRGKVLNYMVGDPEFELVAGERRVLAAREAGLPLVPAMVHDYTDDQALDVQLVENLQREGLHELVECEGYEQLRKNGHTVEQIADKVGKSASYVYKRLELAACGPEVRKAFYAGTLDASKALLISRLPGDLQKKALKEITDDRWSGPMSFRQAREHLQRHYMLRLDEAPFKTEDAGLVPAAGACGACPKNTVQQAGLFGDVSKEYAALCTDSKCFQAKIAAAAAARVKAAQAAGQVVIEGKAAAKALAYGSDFVKLDANCYEDSKNRTYQQLLGKDAVVTVAVDPESGKAVEVIKKDDAKKIMKARGVKLRNPQSHSGPTRSAKEIEKEKADKAKHEAEEKFLMAMVKAIHEKPPKPLTDDELAKVADAMINRCYADEVIDYVFGRGVTPNTMKLNCDGLLRVIRTHVLAEHVADGDKKVILDTAKRHGVNAEKIRLDLATPKLAKVLDQPKAKKAAKKK